MLESPLVLTSSLRDAAVETVAASGKVQGGMGQAGNGAPLLLVGVRGGIPRLRPLQSVCAGGNYFFFLPSFFFLLVCEEERWGKLYVCVLDNQPTNTTILNW